MGATLPAAGACGDRDFRGDRFRHRHFDDFVFFGDFGDPFFYSPLRILSLTDITPTVTDTILTINPVTRAELIL